MVSLLLYNVVRDEDGEIRFLNNDFRLEVTGHSGFSIKGKDIVCAGISAIVETAIFSISRVAKIRQKIVQDNGRLETKISSSELLEEKRRDFILILKMMLTGLEEIQKIHPEAIEINFINN